MSTVRQVATAGPLDFLGRPGLSRGGPAPRFANLRESRRRVTQSARRLRNENRVAATAHRFDDDFRLHAYFE